MAWPLRLPHFSSRLSDPKMSLPLNDRPGVSLPTQRRKLQKFGNQGFPLIAFSEPKGSPLLKKRTQGPQGPLSEKFRLRQEPQQKYFPVDTPTGQQSRFGQPVARKCTDLVSGLFWLQVTENSTSNWFKHSEALGISISVKSLRS